MKTATTLNGVKMTPAKSTADQADDVEYNDYLVKLQQNFINGIADMNTKMHAPLFTTDINPDALWAMYLSGLSADIRQTFNCNCCRQFIQRFGGLVTIDANGRKTSALWRPEDAPDYYKASIAAMKDYVENKRVPVDGVFLTDIGHLGQERTGMWRHLSLTVPKQFVVPNRRLKTAYQAMAEKKGGFKVLKRSLQKFNISVVAKALELLESNALYRAEKVIGPVKWFKELLDKHHQTRPVGYFDNIMWLAVATAPAGFTHIRSGVAGTLLEDIAAGKSMDTVKKAFAAKIDPLQYQRPQVAPGAQNVARAEKIVEELGLTPALKRRFATLNDITAMGAMLYLPVSKSVANKAAYKETTTFSHVTTKDTLPRIARVAPTNGSNITWARFKRDILPNAAEIQLYLDTGHQSFSAITTASNPEAPPIIQWDMEDKRNPFAWYLYSGGSLPSQWNLKATTWVNVNGICEQPSMWNGGFEHQGQGAFFLLEDCLDNRSSIASMCLFPEILKTELREVRATIEQFSRQGELDIPTKGHPLACGIKITNNDKKNHIRLRVTSKAGLSTEFNLDRWD